MIRRDLLKTFVLSPLLGLLPKRQTRSGTRKLTDGEARQFEAHLASIRYYRALLAKANENHCEEMNHRIAFLKSTAGGVDIDPYAFNRYPDKVVFDEIELIPRVLFSNPGRDIHAITGYCDKDRRCWRITRITWDAEFNKTVYQGVRDDSLAPRWSQEADLQFRDTSISQSREGVKE